MELNVPTIAQRKAARRNQSSSQESIVVDQNTRIADSVESLSSGTITTPSDQLITKEASPEVTLSTAENMTPKLSSENIQPKIDRNTLIALARSMGLELSAPKRIWIKHSYSVTPESKETFSHYCEVLGFKMQDGLEEAFQDWFKKKESEYQAINSAKNK